MKYPSTEFDHAIETLCDGAIDDVSLSALNELLRTNADARDEYLWRVELHGKLATPSVGTSSSSTTNFSPLSPKAVEAQRGAGSFAWMAGIAATVLLVGGLWWNSSSNQDSPSRVVAQVTSLSDCRWMELTTEASQIESGSEVRSGQRLELTSGSLDLEFNHGARVKIVGPAILEPRSDKSALLIMGKAYVVAESPQSKGFRLITRTSTFVDISTEFSATVAPDGLSRLDVTNGAVDVLLNDGEPTTRLQTGDSLYVEPGDLQIMTRIEEGDGTSAFEFPTIQAPSNNDLADQSVGEATIHVVAGSLKAEEKGASGPVSVLLDGAGQSHGNSPGESAFFADHTTGRLVVDLGRIHSISKVNSYSWHQHHLDRQHRHRARQRYTLYGFSGDRLPDDLMSPEEAGWLRIARVNTDRHFDVEEPLDRPAQQASSVKSAQGEVGRFRYLMWQVEHHTFFGELDVFGSPIVEADRSTTLSSP